MHYFHFLHKEFTMTYTKSQILSVIDQYASRFKEISSYIGANPELGNEEYLASARLKEELIYHGFDVEAPSLDWIQLLLEPTRLPNQCQP